MPITYLDEEQPKTKITYLDRETKETIKAKPSRQEVIEQRIAERKQRGDSMTRFLEELGYTPPFKEHPIRATRETILKPLVLGLKGIGGLWERGAAAISAPALEIQRGYGEETEPSDVKRMKHYLELAKEGLRGERPTNFFDILYGAGVPTVPAYIGGMAYEAKLPTSKLATKIGQPTFEAGLGGVKTVLNTLEKVGQSAATRYLSFLAEVPEWATQQYFRARDFGRDIFKKQNLSKEIPKSLLNKINTGLTEIKSKLGEAIAKVREPLLEDENLTINIKKVITDFEETAYKYGILNKSGKANLPLFKEISTLPKERKEILDILRKMNYYRQSGTPVTFAEAKLWIDDIDSLLGKGEFYSKTDKAIVKFSNQSRAALKIMRNNLNAELEALSPEFAETNKQYSNFLRLHSRLRENLTKRNVKGDLKQIIEENALEGSDLMAFQKLLKPEKRFMYDLTDHLAAKEFMSTSPHLWRAAAVGMLTGQVGFPTTFATSIPAIDKYLLKLGSMAKRPIEKATPYVEEFMRRTYPALFNR